MAVGRWLPVAPRSRAGASAQWWARQGFRSARYPAAALVVLLAAGSAQGAPPTPAPVPPTVPAHNVWNVPRHPFTTLTTQLATDQLPAVSPPGSPQIASSSPNTGGDLGIPETVLDSYHRAETAVNQQSPGCRLSWTMLAGIGKVESGHADSGDVTNSGDVVHPIYGPALNGGNNTAAIPSANGSWSRAEGPMQMLPSTWGKWASDGNGDGRADPQNVYDASLGAGRYLCTSGRDLSTDQGQQQAILSYNPSAAYYQLVIRWVHAYESGSTTLQDTPGAFDPDTRAHGGEPSNPTDTPPTPPTERAPDTDHAAPQPTPKPDPKPEPKPTPARPPAPPKLLPPKLLPPPVERALPPPLGSAPTPNLAPAVNDITKTLGVHQ